LIGLPVIRGGKTVGLLEQAVLEESGKKLRGIIIREGLGGARWVDRENIQTIGGVSVLVSGDLKKPPREANFRLGRVQDTSGLRLGTVTDALINSETLEVEALEISNGPLDDLLHGRWLASDFVLRKPEGSGKMIRKKEKTMPWVMVPAMDRLSGKVDKRKGDERKR
jgi:uncharacterized protein YrrD